MVRLENVSKIYGDEGIRNVSADFTDNKIHTVIGRSGSGKSLMLRNILGLVRPDSGRIMYGDTDINKCSYERLREMRSGIGVLFQNNALFDSMTVYENIALPIVYDGSVNQKEAALRVNNVLKRVGLEGIAEKQIRELSGGMQKRVAIARALIREPETLFYDEPITGLDPLTAHRIIELIKTICADMGNTTVLITHDIRGFIEFTDYVMLLDYGNLLFYGTKEEFMHFDNNIARAYLEMAGVK